VSHTDPARQPPKKPVKKLIALLAALAACGAIVLYVAAAAYIATPAAAQRAAILLTDLLGQPVAVGSLHIRGVTLSAENIIISAPRPGEAAELARIARLAISPDILSFLTGKRQLRLIAVEGGQLSIGRDAKGEWNFSGIRRKLSEPRETSPTDLRIGRLILRDCAVTVEGRGIRHLSVDIADISTKGSTTSDIDLSGAVTGGDAFRLKGTFQGGSDPSFNLDLKAPRIPLEILTRTLPKLDANVYSGGTFGLDLTARRKDGDLAVTAEMPFTAALSPSQGARLPLDGTLSLAAAYSQKEDRATVDRCSLSLRDLLRLEATAEMRQAREKGLFSAAGSLSAVNIDRLLPLAPETVRKDLAAAGTLSIPSLQLSGDRQLGVTGGSGRLLLRSVSLTHKGTTIVSGSAADITLGGKGREWQLSGNIRQQENSGDALIRNLKGALSARLSPRFAVISATLAPVSAAIMEGAVRGEIRFIPAAAAPLSASLHLERTPVAAVNRFIPPDKLLFSKGSATADLKISGRSAKELSGTLQLSLSGLEGSAAVSPFSAASAATEGRFSVGKKGLALAGKAVINKGIVKGEDAAASFGYALADGRISLSRLDSRLGETSLRVESASGPLPKSSVSAKGSRLPVRAEIRGAAIRRGELEVSGASASVDAVYATADINRWLEGGASLVIPSLSLRGSKLANASGQLQFSRGGAKARITGSAVEGTVTAQVSGDPFAPAPAASFSLDLEGLSASRLAALASKPLPVTASAGTLSGSAKGDIDRAAGLRCSFTTDLQNLALVRERKTLFSRGGLSSRGSYAGKNLVIDEALLTIGDGIKGRLTGKVTDAVSPARSGSFKAEVQPTPLNAILDSFVNLLPPLLQQASADGDLALGADLRLRDGSILLDGSADLKGVTMEIPAQRVLAGAVNGRLPFSVIIGKTGAEADEQSLHDMTRKNYPELLQTFRSAKDGSRVTLDRLQVGAFELGKTSLDFSAAAGKTELLSLRSDLYGGALLGRGFVGSSGGVTYGANLLINDLSLQRVCEGIPAIRGYLSGKVDGLLELYRESGAKGGLAGRIDIWSRAGGREKMLISKEFLQKLAGKDIKSLFFTRDRPFDRGEVSVFLDNGYLTFDRLDISHTNLLGVRDLSVTVVEVQNRISLNHLMETLKEAAARGTGAKGKGKGTAAPEQPAAPEPEVELDWLK
jgi:hypothetical protein